MKSKSPLSIYITCIVWSLKNNELTVKYTINKKKNKNILITREL